MIVKTQTRQEATAEEVARWKDAVVFFYKKVLFKKQDKVRDAWQTQHVTWRAGPLDVCDRR